MFSHNSTIEKKLKPCASCGKPCYWFSKKRCQDCSRIEDTQKRMEAVTEQVIKEEDLSGLIQDADAIFSRFTRLKYANEFGIVKCFTCDTKKHWTLLQCGHFIGRSHLRLRWDERNTKPQCIHCNEMKNGNIGVYRENLENESPSITEYLYDEMRLVHKISREEIRAVISEYTPKVKALLKTLDK